MGPVTTTVGATGRGRGPEIEGIPLLCAYSSVLSNGKWPLLLETERAAAPVTGKGRALHQYSEGSRPHRPIADYGFGVCGWAGFEVCGWAEDPAGHVPVPLPILLTLMEDCPSLPASVTSPKTFTDSPTCAESTETFAVAGKFNF